MFLVGVIRQRVDAFFDEELGDFVDRLLREAIDNAGVPGMLFLNELQELLACVVALRNSIPNVRTIEARDEDTRVEQLEPRQHLLARRFVSSRRQRDARTPG